MAAGSRARGSVTVRTWCGPTNQKQKPPFGGYLQFLDFLEFFGAGEGIRTLDPNLGKVVLYP
jgi:hypothetical protein